MSPLTLIGKLRSFGCNDLHIYVECQSDIEKVSTLVTVAFPLLVLPFWTVILVLCKPDIYRNRLARH
jgi:hypothetical protein